MPTAQQYIKVIAVTACVYKEIVLIIPAKSADLSI